MANRPAYFDSSVLVKLYIHDEGSSFARTLVRRHRCLVSALGPVEAMSALHRRLAAGDLSPRDVRRLEVMIKEDRTHWALLEVDGEVLDRAEQVIRETGVRTLDAVHLASAITVQAYSRFRIPFVTGDTQQHDACARLRLDAVWVG